MSKGCRLYRAFTPVNNKPKPPSMGSGSLGAMAPALLAFVHPTKHHPVLHIRLGLGAPDQPATIKHSRLCAAQMCAAAGTQLLLICHASASAQWSAAVAALVATALHAILVATVCCPGSQDAPTSAASTLCCCICQSVSSLFFLMTSVYQFALILGMRSRVCRRQQPGKSQCCNDKKAPVLDQLLAEGECKTAVCFQMWWLCTPDWLESASVSWIFCC